MEVGKGEINGDRKKLCFGRMIQCADDVLLSCTLETCMVLGTNVTSVNSIKNNCPHPSKETH